MVIVSPLLDFWIWGSTYYPQDSQILKFHEASERWPREEKQKSKPYRGTTYLSCHSII